MGIRFERVSYHYSGNAKRPYEAIKDISLEIAAKNEFIALVGHTGSGKSTLAQHMNALVFPSEGTVELFGNRITSKRNKTIHYNDLRRKVGLVFQFPEYQLFEETVEKDIMFGPLNFRVPLEEARELAKRAIGLVGLDESYLRRNPFNLSGGEKKRVSIAGILALDPEILVLDEPTSGLDPAGKIQMMDLFASIQKQTEKTIIVISHDMDLVYRYATRVLVLDQGSLVFDGSPGNLFRRRDLASLHLDYPQTIRVLKQLNATLGLKLDVYQKTVEAAAAELKRGLSL
jgi:energy-coupling factor transport system ATP-binding protein